MSESQDRSPSFDNPNGFCHQCGMVAAFWPREEINLNQVYVGEDYESVSVLQCQGCKNKMVLISQNSNSTTMTGGLRINRLEPHHYYPLRQHSNLTSAVPEKIASCFYEGQRCLSVNAYRGAVTMFRNTLSLIVHFKGSDKAKAQNTLKKSLDVMREENPLMKSVSEMTDLIRFEGNAGAHQDTWEPIEKDTAVRVQGFTSQLLEIFFEFPAKIERGNQNRTSRTD